MIKDQLIK